MKVQCLLNKEWGSLQSETGEVNTNFEHLSRELSQLSDHVTRTQQDAEPMWICFVPEAKQKSDNPWVVWIGEPRKQPTSSRGQLRKVVSANEWTLTFRLWAHEAPSCDLSLPGIVRFVFYHGCSSGTSNLYVMEGVADHPPK